MAADAWDANLAFLLFPQVEHPGYFTSIHPTPRLFYSPCHHFTLLLSSFPPLSRTPTRISPCYFWNSTLDSLVVVVTPQRVSQASRQTRSINSPDLLLPALFDSRPRLPPSSEAESSQVKTARQVNHNIASKRTARRQSAFEAEKHFTFSKPTSAIFDSVRPVSLFRAVQARRGIACSNLTRRPPTREITG